MGIPVEMGNAKGVRRDFAALERRRFEAIRLLQQGVKQAEVARPLQVVQLGEALGARVAEAG